MEKDSCCMNVGKRLCGQGHVPLIISALLEQWIVMFFLASLAIWESQRKSAIYSHGMFLQADGRPLLFGDPMANEETEKLYFSIL